MEYSKSPFKLTHLLSFLLLSFFIKTMAEKKLVEPVRNMTESKKVGPR